MKLKMGQIKRWSMSIVALGLLVNSIALEAAQAGGGGGSSGSIRSQKKFGILAGVLSEPYLSLWNFGIGYNLTDFITLEASYGQFEVLTVSAQMVGAGVKLQVPKWRLSPYFGANYAMFISGITMVVAGNSTSIGSGTGVISVCGGLRWTTGKGFMFGAGYNYPIGGVFSGIGLPGVHIGMFF